MTRLLLTILSLALLGSCLHSISLTDAGEKGTALDLGGVKSVIPSDWKKETPKSFLRKYEYSLPKAKGDKEDAELAIFFFKGGGGGVEANLARWKNEFLAPKGKTIEEVSKVKKFDVGEVKVVYLDLSGTYKYKKKFSDTKYIPKENFRRIGVIFQTKVGPYFLKLTGPEKTIAKHQKSFDNWLKGFK